MSALQKGDAVKIFHDPRTRSKAEGEAVLVELWQKYPDGSEEWAVRFDGETDLYPRTIFPEVAP